MTAVPARRNRQQCVACGGAVFAVHYDRAAMGYDVECASCGETIGGLRPLAGLIAPQDDAEAAQVTR